jgi:signal peptidase I
MEPAEDAVGVHPVGEFGEVHVRDVQVVLDRGHLGRRDPEGGRVALRRWPYAGSLRCVVVASLLVVAAVTIAAGAVVAARRCLLVVRVVGASMLPTLRPGERVLALRRRYGRRLRRGDLVVSRMPAKAVAGSANFAPDVLEAALPLVVKRAIALAGDPAPGGGTVPAGCVFVVGDHPESTDSRHYGPIPLSRVVGRVVARLGQPAESAG